MSNPILPTINPVAYIRTYVPVAIGSLITFLLAQYSWLNDVIAYLNTTYGTGWRDLLIAAATAAVIALYYWGARHVGEAVAGRREMAARIICNSRIHRQVNGPDEELVGGYAVPTDLSDELQCNSCQ